MSINSANELHELVETLGHQFRVAHHPAAQSLWSQADHHIESVLLNVGHWVTRELEMLHSDWQVHKHAIQDAETWFAHHASMLAKVAERPVSLATTALAGPVGEILSQVGERSDRVAGWLGAPSLPHDVLEAIRRYGNKDWKHFASGAGKAGDTLDKFFFAHGFSHYGDVVDGGGKVLAGASVVFGGIHMAYDFGSFEKKVGTGDASGAAFAANDLVASGLKAVPGPPFNPFHLAGWGMSLIADDIHVASTIDRHANYMPSLSWTSMRDVYLPGAVDGLKTGVVMIAQAY